MIFFRLPFAENFFTVEENSAENAVTFFPFVGGERIDFKGNLKEITATEIWAKPIFSNEAGLKPTDFSEETKPEYFEKLNEAINFVKENGIPKLVISRIKILDYKDLNSNKINLTETFLNISKAYANAFSYCFVKENICWIGAFSEVLGKFNKTSGIFETMSLAGTLPIDEAWTPKEIEEQKPVTDYIENILSEFSTEVEISKTKDHISGAIKHLRTDFSIKTTENSAEKIVEQLHPTPAVCGIPKDLCQQEISRLEKYPRSLYSGYIKVETKENIFWFVNLRCAEFTENAALIHVGGGITAQSNIEKEWRETELKAEAVVKNLA